MKISSGFHEQDNAHLDHLHQGIDFAVPRDTPVHSLRDGTIVNITHDMSGYGNAIWMKFDDGYTALYGHLDKVNVHVGQHITQGEIIALSGNTGHSTGPHLHFGIKDPSGSWVDPNQYLVATPHQDMIVRVGGQTLSPIQDHIETWAHDLFGIPRSVWDAGTLPQQAHVIDPQNAFTQGMLTLLREVGHFFLQMGPGLFTTIFCAAILGAMIGSQRCKHWAGVSALATILTGVMSNYGGR